MTEAPSAEKGPHGIKVRVRVPLAWAGRCATERVLASEAHQAGYIHAGKSERAVATEALLTGALLAKGIPHRGSLQAEARGPNPFAVGQG